MLLGLPLVIYQDFLKSINNHKNGSVYGTNKLPSLYHRQNFSHIIIFPDKPKKSKKISKTYRNPIFLAKEYRQMIDSGEVRNQVELASKLGVSRARVTQILNLLKLDSLTINELENFGDPMDGRMITERKLRGMIKHSPLNLNKILPNNRQTLGCLEITCIESQKV